VAPRPPGCTSGTPNYQLSLPSTPEESYHGVLHCQGEIWEILKGNNFISYTYAGHPVCAAAAIKAMEIYVRDRVVENAAAVGRYAMERLRRDFEPLPCVGGVNGLGLMLGIEIVADKATRRPFDTKLNVMQTVQDRALDRGLFVRVAGIGGTPSDRIVFAPPLVITKQEVDKALDILYPIVAELEPS